MSFNQSVATINVTFQLFFFLYNALAFRYIEDDVNKRDKNKGR